MEKYILFSLCFVCLSLSPAVRPGLKEGGWLCREREREKPACNPSNLPKKKPASLYGRYNPRPRVLFPGLSLSLSSPYSFLFFSLLKRSNNSPPLFSPFFPSFVRSFFLFSYFRWVGLNAGKKRGKNWSRKLYNRHVSRERERVF